MLTMNMVNAWTHHFDPYFDNNLVLEKAVSQDFVASLQVKPLRELLR